MADTIADVHLDNTEYQEVYAATGIPVGTAIGIFHKGQKGYKLVISATKPDVTTPNFLRFSALPHVPANISAGESGVWLYGYGSVNVQVQ